jgi:hypothetical protein
MKEEMLFLAPYPAEDNIKDGMIQRVKNIDDLFPDKQKTYLNISFRRNIRKLIIQHSNNVTEYKVNAFLHLFEIWKFVSASKYIYIHSIYLLARALLPVAFSQKKTICLDVHGVVPEENRILRGRLSYLIYSIIEWIAFKKITHAIYVTEAMFSHFKTKYTTEKIKSTVYNIYPNLENMLPLSEPCTDKTVIIYSGNVQQWQNVEDMVSLILNNIHDNYEYIILTGEPVYFKRLFERAGAIPSNVKIKSVLPHDLQEYYRQAHYGFILRDDITVNRVANPTKMIEYLMFGIVPIVRLKEIGDFYKLGYEYFSESAFNENLQPKKSAKNVKIAKQVSIENKKIDITAFLLS